MEFLSQLLFVFFGLGAGLLLEKYLPSWLANSLSGRIVLFSCIVLFVAALSTHYVAEKNAERDAANQPVFAGNIYPGNKPDPRSLESNQRLLQLGDDLDLITTGNANSVLSKNGKTFLSIGVNSNGQMTISATVIDSQNQNIVRIINNEFQASPDYAFLPKQPDKNSLIVRDSDGVEVLNIKFINAKTIRITGRFVIPGNVEPVVITADRGIEWPGGGGIGHLTIEATGNGGIIDFPQ